LRDGRVIEERQPHFRGGAEEPLGMDEIAEKFRLNCRHGGFDAARIERLIEATRGLLRTDQTVTLAAFGG